MFSGILGVITGIIILEDCIKREKKVLRKTSGIEQFMLKLKPFVTSKGGFHNRKTAYYRFGMSLLMFGLYFMFVPGILVSEYLSISVWSYVIIYALVVFAISLTIFRLYWIRIFRWAINYGIVNKDEVPAKDYHLY